ncbi:UDP-glycosyltransferase 88F3-like isoform X1 [Quercus robur]|uniref:UDP-glycosyltransferase 88F3-like isoform X1 n=1 Tax=Quercus robur TaxID=38942 RepID=UPI0021622CD9|nr:UDP-glycosyltransferase 88F3-like isoform X1 [Quercus robur]
MQDTIILFPAPGMGHVISMVELGKLILHHYSNNFTITILLTTGSFWNTPSVTSYIHRISQSNSNISFYSLPSVSVDTTPTRSRAAMAFDFIRVSSTHVPNALQQISHTSTIRALIIDIFCTSALSIAKQLNLPVYYFYTSGAYALAAFLYFPKIHEQITKSFKDLNNTELHLPGMSPLKSTHMPEPTLDRDDPAYWDMVYFCSHLPKSNGIIANTFEDLEPKVIKTIADGVCVPDEPTPPVYYIGPLIAEAEERAGDDGNEGGDENECLSWLDKQPSRSVVFLCFGCRGSFSVAQVRDIANGLERSGQRFLWVVKKPPQDEKTKQTEQNTLEFNLDSVLPEGFLERTKDRGMVVKSWAPQVAVLRKESVGGFVTHCGWNSVLEAVVAGVPMVAWPLYAEQHLNRNVLVKDMKMAIGVEQGEGDGFVSGDEVERRVRELMESEEGRELRERIWKMREMASAALGEFGSSTRALVKFVEALG